MEIDLTITVENYNLTSTSLSLNITRRSIIFLMVAVVQVFILVPSVFTNNFGIYCYKLDFKGHFMSTYDNRYSGDSYITEF